MALWVFMSDMAIILLIPKDPTMWHRNLKGLPLREDGSDLGTDGLIRDQRYRTDHDAGMPMPD
jgi:hypothetical protein